jgi:hypothetical protein
VGPRAILDAVVKRKIPSPRRESNPRTPIVQPVAQRYIYKVHKVNAYRGVVSVSMLHLRNYSNLDEICYWGGGDMH